MTTETKSTEMLFTIVTPSFNQGQYIEQTIQSVLSQEGDFSIQYIIADGESTDNTVEIIKKYDELIKSGSFPIKCKNIAFSWWSHKDKGQADALNQGFTMAQGTILAWINSDDFYEAGAFQKVADAFKKNGEIDIVYGDGYTLVDSADVKTSVLAPKIDYRRLLFHGCEIFQPSAFFTRKSFVKVGGIDDSLHYSFDYDLWLAILKQGKAFHLNEHLSNFRIWPQSKTSSSQAKFIEEEKIILKKHTSSIFGPYYLYMLKRVAKRVLFRG